MARNIRNILRENLLLILIIVGVIIGFVLGLSLNGHIQSTRYDDEKRKEIVMLISFLGDLFIRLLKLLIVPLVVTSIVMAVAKLDTRTTGKLGRRTVIYYLTTTFIAVIIGIILVVSIRPGDQTAGEKLQEDDSKHVNSLDSFLDLLRNLFPDNLVETTFRTSVSSYKKKVGSYNEKLQNTTDIKNTTKGLVKFVEKTMYDPWSINNSSDTVKVFVETGTKNVRAGVRKADRMNVLGLIMCSMAFGIALSRLGREAQAMIGLFETMMKVVMSLINFVMWTSPVGICSLIAGKLVEMEDIGKTFESLALFIVTVIVGITIQTLVVYPLIYFFFVRKNPFQYMFGLQAAVFTAFGTDSSAATLPVTIKCVKEVNKVDERIAHFVLPIGATVNMDGTALYEAAACIYIAQLNNFSFGMGKIVITSLTATAASIGAAAVPSAGLITLLMVLEAAGLPTGDVGLLYSIDWFLDRFRTMCNVVGDAIGCAVVERLSRSDFGNDLEANQSQMQEIGISSNISDDISAVSHQNHNVS